MTYEQAALRALAEGRPDVAQVYATLRSAYTVYRAGRETAYLQWIGPGEEDDVLTAIMQPPRKPPNAADLAPTRRRAAAT